jgi:hypothetical protein
MDSLLSFEVLDKGLVFHQPAGRDSRLFVASRLGGGGEVTFPFGEDPKLPRVEKISGFWFSMMHK